MSPSINPRVHEIAISGIRQFANQLVHYPDAVNLTIGQPDFPTPDNVKQAAISAIENDLTGYSHNAGLIDLRNAVSKFFYGTYNLTYNAETDIIITIGASEAIDTTFRAILEPGDEVILPAPFYTGYEPIIKLLGCTPVYLNTSDTGFVPDPKRLEALINENTKAILFNFPSNPTGVTIEKEQMDALEQVLAQKDVFIVSDEIYSLNTFEGTHTPFASYPSLKDKTFTIHGLSKSHSMTGWRIGFLMGPTDVMKHCIKIHQYNAVCASLPSQYAAIEALTNGRDNPAKMNEHYINRRDYLLERLHAMGLPVEIPKGAFYLFPSIQHLGMTSFEFCTKLLQDGGVACVPGSAFSSYGEGFIRISYAYKMDTLIEGMDRMDKFLQSLNNTRNVESV
ncbi:aminotransferase class I/II-fold pyridoxal phosphate-dependent enzyme [Paenisporosarcina cavernae]|uniref:Aminotransferase n=1 Tax=Paenisporosarcina cavernae TaxID=2320858 RepID=A0A385YSC3_9BACL|nr:aminotransferase class I/II-fold pyridoxal phosphate-dependent enzyme [Paenisporosarcina cavernae]AYC28887.1 aminotransferase class I/II-fold pyridoxal phosphate-dependent enzyme [Paenisporosarcina cavernae]